MLAASQILMMKFITKKKQLQEDMMIMIVKAKQLQEDMMIVIVKAKQLEESMILIILEFMDIEGKKLGKGKVSRRTTTSSAATTTTATRVMQRGLYSNGDVIVLQSEITVVDIIVIIDNDST